MLSSAPLRRSSVVVGREAELDLLQRALRGAPKGDTGCVVLIGEGGIGKTRLLSEATTVAHQLGCVVLTGRVPIVTRPPFGLIASALRSWLRAVPTPEPLGAYDRGLATVLPEWPCPDGTALDDSQQRLLALEGIAQLLRRIAADGGVVLVVDDVHAADAESIEALRYVANAAIPGVVVLAAMRPGEDPAADGVVRALRHDLIADVVTLDPLDERGV
ncbi:MAG TPA: ATP-binding protein, partial [bacterium]|nr:ATP-binding protein [bacterium]